MTSLTLYISIWMGIILVGALLGLTTIQANIEALAENPVQGMYEIVRGAFTDPLFLSLFAGTAVGAIVLTNIISGGYSLMFIIPLGIVIGMLQLFILPSELILNESLFIPEVRMIYVVFIGGLTILTIASFTVGRN